MTGFLPFFRELVAKIPKILSVAEFDFEPSFEDDSDSITDRRAALWSCAAILSSDLGVGVYGATLAAYVLRNLKSPVLEVRASAFYGANLVARAPLGAELIERESKMAWKTKKRFVGQHVATTRLNSSNGDSLNSIYWHSESSIRNELYIDSQD